MASGERTTTADRSLSSALRLAERSNTEQDLPGFFLDQYHPIPPDKRGHSGARAPRL
jgi:hypothetical protein